MSTAVQIARSRLRIQHKSVYVNDTTLPDDVALETKAPAGLPARTLRFILATDALDRDMDVVLPSGIRTNEYMRNPIMQWAHNLMIPPIAKCVNLALVSKGRILVGDFQFAETKFADEIYQLYKGGFLNAVSVGFRTKIAGPPDSTILMSRPELARTCKRVVQQADLYEVSSVPIGSNPEALRLAEQKGLTVPPELKGVSTVSADLDYDTGILGRIVASIGSVFGLRPETVKSLNISEIEHLSGLLEPEDQKGKRKPQSDAEDTDIADAMAAASTSTADDQQATAPRGKSTKETGSSVGANEGEIVSAAANDKTGDAEILVEPKKTEHCGQCGKSPCVCAKCGGCGMVTTKCTCERKCCEKCGMGDKKCVCGGKSAAKQVDPAEIERKHAVHFVNAPLCDGSWDAAAARKRLLEYATGADGNVDWRKYEDGFAWFDAADPEKEASYKLPHHDIVDGRFCTHRRGVEAAAAAVNGARGENPSIPEEDMNQVRSHLAKHYKQWGGIAPWTYTSDYDFRSAVPDTMKGVRTIDEVVADTIKAIQSQGLKDDFKSIFEACAADMLARAQGKA